MASTAPGLYRRGDTWWIRYSVNGKQIRRSAETGNKKTAEALLGKIRAEIHEGRHFPEKRRASMTVAQLSAAWLARSSDKQSLRNDEQRFKRIVEFFGPDRLIVTIDTEDVVAFKEALKAEAVSRQTEEGRAASALVRRILAKGPVPYREARAQARAEGVVSLGAWTFARRHLGLVKVVAGDPPQVFWALPETAPPAPAPKAFQNPTVNRHLVLLGSALRYASRSLKQHTLDPMHGVDLLHEFGRDRIATPEEYEALLARATPKLRLAIVIGYWTGMRLGEVIGLRWDRIDLKTGVARLKAKGTKTKKPRIVPLPSQVVDALKLETRPLDGGPIFTVEVTDKATGEVSRKPMKPTSMSPQFSRLVKKLGIKDLRYHDFRHTTLTRLRRAGVDIFTMARISGHEDLDMLARYNTITEEDLVAAVRKATEGFGNG